MDCGGRTTSRRAVRISYAGIGDIVEAALKQLIHISQRVGSDPHLVQGGGGNTSVKTSDREHMYIKASGGAIRDISETSGWRRLHVSWVRDMLTDPALRELRPTDREPEIARQLLRCCDDSLLEAGPPSVESHLHAALNRYVIHLHPTAVNAYVCAKEGKARLEQLFKQSGRPPLWVPYADPGYGLAVSLERLLKGYRTRYGVNPEVLFLDKHGLIITGDNQQTVLRLLQEVIRRCESSLKAPRQGRAPVAPSQAQVTHAQLAVRRALWEAAGTRLAVRHFLEDDIAAFLAQPEARRLVSGPPLTPEELACAQGTPAWVTQWEAATIGKIITKRISRGEPPPLAYLQTGLGLLIAGTDRSIPAIRDLVAAALTVRRQAAALGGVSPLTARQRQFIAEWEGESLRRAALAGRQQGELVNRIAVVSGAGSGLGRAIATGLARAGAAVGLADIDLIAARETAALITSVIPSAPVLPVGCDVTDETSVDQSVAAITQRWGGLDILVNAAGIAPAAPLVELEVRAWRRTLEINLTGYVLMARTAARIMVEQGMGGSIINVSSKSGLEASRSNTAYNATKAGEIHMARGWALELGSHGIRVNSIAPGNVFQGSRIWNPEYIEECARKYGLRPEEVIPYYVNMTALKREIFGDDIAASVIFLCSDRADKITGQTLVVDGGQVMVR